MPKFEPKQVQKDLEAGQIWPVYWLYGSETMKSRELLKRIRASALGKAAEQPSSANIFQESWLEGSEVSSAEVLDSAHAMPMGGGAKFVVVRDAHVVKEPEIWAELFGPAQPAASASHVVVFVSKDLDQRKKFSKLLVEKAAVVACEEIAEQDREAWVQYLAKKKGLTLTPFALEAMRAMDPWGLDMVDRELEKMEAAINPEDAQAILRGSAGGSASEEFVEVFFAREKLRGLQLAERFSDSPDEALPLLGLLSWNVRMLSQVLKDREQGTRDAKLGSFMIEKFSRYARAWSLADVVRLQTKLAEVDFGIKQTPKLPLGLWADLVLAFARD